VAVERARVGVREGGDLEPVERELRALYDLVDEETGYVLHRRILFGLSDVVYQLGRSGEARRLDEELVELTVANSDAFNEASARLNLASRVLARGSYGEGTQQAADLFRRALETADDSGNGPVEARCLLTLGRLVGGREGREHLRAALARAQELGDPSLVSEVKVGLAEGLRDEQPVEARTLLEQAVGQWVEAEDDRSMAYGWTSRATVTWATLPKEEAVADSLRVLDHFEALRERQHLGQGRADFFSSWTEAFYWLSGRLLESYSRSGDLADVALAFEVAERMRARVLQDALQTSGAVPALPASDPRAQRRQELVGDVVAANRGLLAPDLYGAAREGLLGDLELLERELAEVDLEISGDHPAVVARPEYVSLPDLEAALEPGTALLTFQIAPWRNIYGDFAGGSWLLASTAGGTRVHPLPDRQELEPKLRVFLGLFERGEVAEEVAAAALYGSLLEEALAALPEEVERLVIVPDGALYLLPFGALRAAAGEPALVERFELTVVPSATLWATWRRKVRTAGETSALVLADPRPVGQTREVGAERGWRGEAFGPLPFARREGRAVLKRLGGSGELLLGDAASERALKDADLEAFEVVHFAAHAVVDGERPHRSAVVLSPGAESEDGLLHPAEIARLDLDGRIVVLAACESALGRVISGEGPLSLARPFFEAGAHTVVANLWRLGDRAAAALFERFYVSLARGETVAGAVRAAQRDRIAAGASVGEWAGLIVLGDGSARLAELPDGEPALSTGAVAVALLTLALLGFVAVKMRRSRRNPMSLDASGEGR
jgi:hypothetical protein